MWADPDGAWHDQTDSIDHRTAAVVAANGEVSIAATGGDALTAEKLRNIFAHFVELEFRKDCDARRADARRPCRSSSALSRTDAQRRFDAMVSIFERAYVAAAGGRPPDPVVNIICDQRTLHDLLGRAGIVLPDGEFLDVDMLTRQQIDAVLAEFVNDPATMLTRRCETTSGQQIHPQQLIQALLTAQVRRVVLDANSTVIDLGERKRLFTGNARLAATLLQQHCQHPGCEVPADRCEIDHNQSHSCRWTHRPGERRPRMWSHTTVTSTPTDGEHAAPTTAAPTTSEPTAPSSCSPANDHPRSPEPTTTTSNNAASNTSKPFANASDRNTSTRRTSRWPTTSPAIG